jgi:chemotaxis signal transduction protein
LNQGYYVVSRGGIVSDELDAFREAAVATAQASAHTALDVLILEQGAMVLAVLAIGVDSVIPWQTPEPLPLSADEVLGVVQDRGRLVIVQRYRAVAERPSRLVVCRTKGGLVGLAATATRMVGAITIQGALQIDAPVHTSAGPLTIIDPERIAERMTKQTQ